MDRWLAAIEADASDDPPQVKIVAQQAGRRRHRVLDRRRDDDRPDGLRCNVSRTSASRAPPPATADTIYTMKCQLKPLDRADYNVTFTDAQWVALQATFPTGVCDFSKPGVGFQPNVRG